MKQDDECVSWVAFFHGSLTFTMQESLNALNRSESFGNATQNLLKSMELLNAQNVLCDNTFFNVNLM